MFSLAACCIRGRRKPRFLYKELLSKAGLAAPLLGVAIHDTVRSLIFCLETPLLDDRIPFENCRRRIPTRTDSGTGLRAAGNHSGAFARRKFCLKKTVPEFPLIHAGLREETALKPRPGFRDRSQKVYNDAEDCVIGIDADGIRKFMQGASDIIPDLQRTSRRERRIQWIHAVGSSPLIIPRGKQTPALPSPRKRPEASLRRRPEQSMLWNSS